ncbi:MULTISPECIES: class I SAM-dependent methyltransferase [unclassified Ruegeria]|uniref:class I SAM-dependent methyltransferase n=1 Tax=unclassified Ruegeria TaxID=2625375 RepID=UPI00148912F0|nr:MULTISPECIES: class I SAM-dependent methyltransferase [unclassified Ruegeria]
MKRVNRTSNFQITVELTNDNFIASPNPAHRARLVTTRLGELAQELDTLDRTVSNYVHGGSFAKIYDRSQSHIAAQDIMEDWQTPIMAEMARSVSAGSGDVLEIGFGRGVAADFVQSHTPKSHTLIECNGAVIEDFFHPWRSQYDGRDIKLVEGFWEDTLDSLPLFDGILFHTYPLTEDEYVERVQRSVTFAAHFFEHAAKHLNSGGRFTYLTMEEDSLSRAHQRALLEHFAEFHVSKINDLEIPEDTRDAHWGNSMVMVTAIGR